MTRTLLKFLNAPAIVLLVAIGVAIQSSFFAYQPFNYFQPDVVLLAVMWCAFRRDFTEGGILTLILANIAEIHSAVPQGLYYIIYMTVFLGVRGLSRMLVVPNIKSMAGLTLGAAVVCKLGAAWIMYLLGASQNIWRQLLVFTIPSSMIEGALAFWVYQWLERFDWITFKNARAEQALEDELQLEIEI